MFGFWLVLIAIFAGWVLLAVFRVLFAIALWAAVLTVHLTAGLAVVGAGLFVWWWWRNR
jgi:hypothetical protein